MRSEHGETERTVRMDYDEFERVAQAEFDHLPEKFRSAIDNVRIVVAEDAPRTLSIRKGYSPRGVLLGLYEGIPLTRRGTGYGMYPVTPDTITLFQRSIESVSRTDQEVRALIRDTLIHEIGHYFGMSEREIRDAGY